MKKNKCLVIDLDGVSILKSIYIAVVYSFVMNAF